MKNFDISVILTAHREGMLAGVTAQSAQAAIDHAAAQGLSCEVIIVLDRSDVLTKETLLSFFGSGCTFVETDFGDPGSSRNAGVSHAKGTHACFLDADDLWSENWLSLAYAFVQEQPTVIAHSFCNVTFGDEKLIWWHQDSESPMCDLMYLEWMNYWDAMAFARIELLRQFPFKNNDLTLGFGHEDWHWNKVTVAAGVPHKPVPNTIHFKRRRFGSQSAQVDQRAGVAWPVQSPAVSTHAKSSS